MADTKISALTGASTPLAGTEVLPIVQSGVTKKVAVSNLTAGRDTAAGSFTATGTPTGSLGVSKWMTQFETSQIARSYICGPDASTYGRWELYRSSSTTPALGWSFAANGDYEVANGNIIPSTAAKGVNFTANTPAAGMTSQLLNYYEEGTWTPVVTASAGSITAYTATGSYTRIGRIVTACFDLIITNNGTGSSLLYMSVPFTGATGVTSAGVGLEYQASGNIIVATLLSAATVAYLVANGGTYPGGASFKIRGSITYQA